MRAPSRPLEPLVIKASLLGQGRQAASSRPSQRDVGRTDGGLRAHSGGLAAKAAGYPSLGGVGVDIYKLFAFLRGTSSSRGVRYRAHSALPCTPSQNPLTTDLPARPWAHGQNGPMILTPSQALSRCRETPATPAGTWTLLWTPSSQQSSRPSPKPLTFIPLPDHPSPPCRPILVSRPPPADFMPFQPAA